MSQMTRFAEALMAYADGREPESYPGVLTREVAAEIARTVPTSWGVNLWAVYGASRMVARQHSDLSAFGTTFDTWSPEHRVHQSWATRHLRRLLALGVVFQESPITGGPICGNCAEPLEYAGEGKGVCLPCPHCTTKHPEFIGLTEANL